MAHPITHTGEMPCARDVLNAEPYTDEKWDPFSTLFTLVYRKKSQGAKSANMEYVQVFEYIYWEETSRAKGRCELGHCTDAASRLCSSRYSAASSARFVALSLC